MAFKRIKENEKYKLSGTKIDALRSIFELKKWPIEQVWEKSDFDRFCDMLKCLTDEEQDLMLLLIKDFIKVDIGEYMQRFYSIFKEFMNSKYIKGKKRLFILPLIDPVDEGKSKSSTTLFYLIKSQLINFKDEFKNIKISYYDSAKMLTEDITFKETDVICLVDDFIGTGDTACNAVNDLLEKIQFQSIIGPKNITVISLVSQYAGFEKLISIIPLENIFTTEPLNRGISDKYADYENKLLLMCEIERRMKKVNKDFSCGYNQSEALVKMARTPNNTFPIFWLQNKVIPVPFPR